MEKKILIIDDEPDFLEVTAFRLESSGYRVAKALNYEEAFASIEKERPDLVLLDLMMPGKDGYEVCNELKTREDTAGIPIILFTAKQFQKSRLKANASFLAADDYILKPFDPAELLAKIARFLG